MNSFVSTFDGQEFDATLFRYIGEDDFGRPKMAFVICVFWYIDALATLDRFPEAREFFEKVLAYRNALGLLSEDVDPHSGELWGGQSRRPTIKVSREVKSTISHYDFPSEVF